MDAHKHAENPVCTSGYDLPTPPWGNDKGGDPGQPHPDEPGVSDFGHEPVERGADSGQPPG